MALKALGYSMNTTDEAELEAAYKWLEEINDTMDPAYVTDEAIDGLITASDGKYMGMMYSGDAAYILSENVFINGRYIKSALLNKAIEDGYKAFIMQHQYPFAVLHFTFPGDKLDVNVHPTKMEIRFESAQEIYQELFQYLHKNLNDKHSNNHI